MNAFARQEIKAVNRRYAKAQNTWHPQRQGFAGSNAALIEYFPILRASTHELVGYEARTINRAQQDSYALMRLQIEQSPGSGMLLLNLDAGDYLRADNSAGGNRFLRLLRQHAWTERDLVIDVSSKTGHAHEAEKVCRLLQEAGIATAFNFAQPSWDIYSINNLVGAHVIKLDAVALINHVGATDIANKMGIPIILLNMVTQAQRRIASELCIDWLQVQTGSILS